MLCDSPIQWFSIGVLLCLGVAGCSDADEADPGVEGEEAAQEEGSSSGDEAEAAAADPDSLGAAPDRVPVAGEGKERARIMGTVEVPGYKQGTVQLDAVVEVDGTPQVVANERYPKPGQFRLVIRGAHESVDLIVYLDVDDDGPTAGDLRYEYDGNPVMLAEGERIEGLVITVKEEQITAVDEAGDAGTAPPPDEAAPEGDPPAAPPTD
jgi:hypothetical protein